MPVAKLNTAPINIGAAMTESQSIKDSDIAIIGISGRFPGAANIEDFWQNLRDGVESISFFSDEELVASGIEPATLKQPNYVKAGAVLSNIELFDSNFFDISPREAATMDPQHRIFLECAWDSLENSGYALQNNDKTIGVYAGVSISSYLLSNLYPNSDIIPDTYSALIGNDKDFLPTRVSYKLNLRGPSINVQTACSTSLVAVHLACQSLLNGECDITLAGGVSVSVPQKTGYLYQEGMIFSPDGHCRAFDAKAKGTVAGNGVGIVVLKRLEEAIADGDYIHAVIKGSAVNNDGFLKVGYTAPGVEGQAAVISEAQAIADIEAETISYIEAHGTGTVLGDPTEITALTKAFRESTEKNGFCAIGSLKTNIGHTDAAAGVAGLIKTVLALKHQSLPPSLHFEQPNPQIDFANTPFYVNGTLSEWKSNGAPRRAGVSSFGIGGTNAHVILEESFGIEPSGPSRPYQLLVLSAKTELALNTLTTNLATYLTQQPDINLADVAYTLHCGRQNFRLRRMFVCQSAHYSSFSIKEDTKALNNLDEERVFTYFQSIENRPVVFMFSDQDVLYTNIAYELYKTEQRFGEEIDKCSEYLKTHFRVDLRQIIYSDKKQTAGETQQIIQPTIKQTVIFVIGYALAKLWMSYGIKPDAMIGRGIGEYVAACIAGVFSIEDALSLVMARDNMMQSNSSEMSPIPSVFTNRVKQMKLRAPQIPYVSNIKGDWITEAEATNSDYWANHSQQTDSFEEGLQHVFKDPVQILLEVGLGHTLTNLAKQHPRKAVEQKVLSSLPCPGDAKSDVTSILNTLGKLWLYGVAVDWPGFYANERRQRLPLPTYPFERQHYWIDAPVKHQSDQDASLQTKTKEAEPQALHSRPNSLKPYVTPRDQVEQTIADIWSKALKFKEIGVHDKFSDLGGNSLLAIDIIPILKDVFKVDFFIHDFIEAPTTEMFASLVKMKRVSSQEKVSILVEIQSGDDSGPPLFCMHPAGGGVFSYLDLAHYLPGQRIYGIQAPSIIGEKEPISLMAKAAHYIEIIKTVHPKGPYLLAGSSYGGNMAVEMAIQLEKKGNQVALVALFDSYPPISYENQFEDNWSFLTAFMSVAELMLGCKLNDILNDELKNCNEDEQWKYILEHLDKLLPEEVTSDEIPKLFNTWKKHHGELRNHVPQIYSGDITLFKAREKLPVDSSALNMEIDETLILEGWSKLSSKPIEYIKTPGNHFDMLDEPHVQILGEILRPIIKKALIKQTDK